MTDAAPADRPHRGSQNLPAVVAGVVLLTLYATTLAPSVTFWDAGEFIAAARTLGIPHPPGTPLFVVLLSAWAHLLWFLPFAVATNLFSAVCTAAAGGLSAAFVARATADRWAGIAAGVVAGAMTSVWLNATETEVYAASLVLSVVAIVVAEEAGRRRDRRWAVLAGYLLVLATPLHLSALVAAPVVVYLAACPPEAPVDWSTGAALTGMAVVTAGVSRVSAEFTIAGFVLILGAPVVSGFVRAEAPERTREARGRAFIFAAIVALSALAILVVRARHDPAINQGNPSTMRQLAYVVGRQQYDVAPLWPRQAPMWLQAANWFEYADWQFALSLAPTVIPSVGRVAVTVVFSLIAAAGAAAHWRRDRRTFIAVALLFASGTVGVLAYLNLKAGASFGWGALPDNAPHEARDRDYFFVLGFWAWGLWAGIGAATLARQVFGRGWPAMIVAGVPIALNWSAVDRRREPEASLPRDLAVALLEPLPANAVFFVSGDNDSYPLWYSQQALQLRRDVAVVTVPLLGAPWYLDELARRYGLSAPRGARSSGELAAGVADAARMRGRPVAAAVSVTAEDRNRIGRYWKTNGLVLIRLSERPAGEVLLDNGAQVIAVDTTLARAWSRRIDRWDQGRGAHPGLDPADEYFANVLRCPSAIVATLQGEARPERVISLDSLCNLR